MTNPASLCDQLVHTHLTGDSSEHSLLVVDRVVVGHFVVVVAHYVFKEHFVVVVVEYQRTLTHHDFPRASETGWPPY